MRLLIIDAIKNPSLVEEIKACPMFSQHYVKSMPQMEMNIKKDGWVEKEMGNNYRNFVFCLPCEIDERDKNTILLMVKKLPKQKFKKKILFIVDGSSLDLQEYLNSFNKAITKSGFIFTAKTKKDFLFSPGSEIALAFSEGFR